MRIGKKQKLLVCAVAAFLAVMGLSAVACAPSSTPPPGGDQSRPTVTVPTPNENGVVTAEMWKSSYPEIYESFMMNATNNPADRVSYIEQNPYIVTLYNGTGFAKDYTEAIGHSFTLTDVNKTQRPHALANCITCKSAEFTALANEMGDAIYSMSFDEIYAKLKEPISCYNCHENKPEGELVIVAGFLNAALGADASKVDMVSAVCGQCHNEYYFDPDTKATTLPWKGLANMTPDAMLAYYNSINFKDMTNAISGADMLKVQHPEFETVLGAGNKMASMGNLNCADCHMGAQTTADDGTPTTSHFLISPLKSPEILEAKCNSCHSDLAKQVQAIQKTVTDRENAIGAKLASLHEKVGAAAADGSKSEDELKSLRSTLRDAQWYWDFCYVENSEGAHNSALAKYVLDKSESLVDAALATF
jgi:nitrite reductase (cytochrome c-552)